MRAVLHESRSCSDQRHPCAHQFCVLYIAQPSFLSVSVRPPSLALAILPLMDPAPRDPRTDAEDLLAVHSQVQQVFAILEAAVKWMVPAEGNVLLSGVRYVMAAPWLRAKLQGNMWLPYVLTVGAAAVFIFIWSGRCTWAQRAYLRVWTQDLCSRRLFFASPMTAEADDCSCRRYGADNRTVHAHEPAVDYPRLRRRRKWGDNLDVTAQPTSTLKNVNFRPGGWKKWACVPTCRSSACTGATRLFSQVAVTTWKHERFHPYQFQPTCAESLIRARDKIEARMEFWACDTCGVLALRQGWSTQFEQDIIGGVPQVGDPMVDADERAFGTELPPPYRVELPAVLWDDDPKEPLDIVVHDKKVREPLRCLCPHCPSRQRRLSCGACASHRVVMTVQARIPHHICYGCIRVVTHERMRLLWCRSCDTHSLQYSACTPRVADFILAVVVLTAGVVLLAVLY